MLHSAAHGSEVQGQCGVSNSPLGPFSAIAPVTLLPQSDLFVKLSGGAVQVHGNIITPVFGNFTANILPTGAFGLGRTISTQSITGGFFDTVRLRAGDSTANEIVTIQVRSDLTQDAVLGRCHFLLLPIPMSDDIDGDGIPNDVELHGILDPSTGQLLLASDGRPVGDFPSLGANPCRKDLAVEIDFQTGANHTHQPDQAALDDVIAAFAAAPVSGSPGCPFDGFDSRSGINLIIDAGNAIPETVTTDAQGNPMVQPWGCDQTMPFHPARAGLFRHSIWAHWEPGRRSGLFPCSDGSFLVALGLFEGGNGNGTVRAQAGTFMHELGHALGLGHGGGDGINLKPNYLSVMNYSFQFEGIQDTGGGNRLDYSRSVLPELDEGALNEGTGLGVASDLRTTWWGPHPNFFYARSWRNGPVQGPLDWNDQNGIESALVSGDVNSDGVCILPGGNGILETDREGDDVVSNCNLNGPCIFNGPNLRCDTQPCNRDVEGCEDKTNENLACVAPGPNGQIDTVPAGNDVFVAGTSQRRAEIVAGPDAVCDTVAAGDDFPGHSGWTVGSEASRP